ncbi:PH domain-containing protein [Pseudoduganella sp. DS3]|uniref:PH domain-containing protein n=1 Tax=Pseudoduganella guangdongensis TaxID=2692179 RepID=A0A6N9HCB8_9BURK|nr:PH domain-containing protein [Pseudoduganella guangdongensis]MYN00887.1 PH domain-containing protein [Pseudoduganella guangdongensis]
MNNERTLWRGRPRQGLMLRGADILMIPFSLVWGGFALYWQYSVVSADAPLLFRVWGIPFVLVGLHMIAGRFFVDAWQRANTDYELNSENIIIRSGIFRRREQVLALRELADFSLTENGKGEGTITFGVSAAGDNFSGLASWPGVEGVPRFDSIANARKVYQIIRNAHYAAGHTRPFGQRLG